MGVKKRNELDPAYCWDLEAMYADDDIWEQDFSRVSEETDDFRTSSGKMKEGPKRLLEILKSRENMERNGLTERSRMLCGDIRRHRELFPSGSFDLVVANPPYFPVERGFLSPEEGRRNARGETQCTLEDICDAAAFLCRTGGSFCLVHKPERLSELLCAMSLRGLEPKRLRLVCHRADSAPSLVLVEGRRGGKPGLKVLPALLLRNPDGSETEEALRIYHRK